MQVTNAILWLALSGQVAAAEEPTPRQVFEKRIMPIFKSANPSSCVQCHLAGVDLKNYIRPTHEQTFVSLRDQGLIDLDKPGKSKILALIAMGKDEKAGAALIHQKLRKAEYEAFADWIKRCAADGRLRALPKAKAAEWARPPRPAAVIRHARTDRLIESFANNVWPMRFRCMGCHTEGTTECTKLIKEHGKRVAWFKAEGPAATLDYLRKSKLIDVEKPDKSLLLRKPLNDVKHGGGQKFIVGDQGYKAFRLFLEDYARIVKDKYADEASLPKVKSRAIQFGSDAWLKLQNTPPEWGDKLLQVNVFAWNTDKKGWETEPIATTDRKVWGKGKLWQHNLTLRAAKGSEREKSWARLRRPALPPGRYLIKVYVDARGQLEKDWHASLGKADFAGQVEVRSAWPEGYGKMTVVDAARVRK
jgi:hypothetical protein